MRRIYKIPVGNISPEKAKIALHNIKKKYQQTIQWTDSTEPLTTIIYYIKKDGLKPKKTSFYTLDKYYDSGDLFMININIKLFDRLKKISSITKTVNKEVEFVNDLIEHKIDIMDHLRNEMIKATKTPKEYMDTYIVDYPSLVKEPRYNTDGSSSDKLHKFITKLKENMI